MPLLPIALVSCAALGLEILLMRLFAIIQWHHFAYLAVSLALLGYGAAGTALAIIGPRISNFSRTFSISAALFGISAPAAFLLVQEIPFNALEVLWDSRQWLWLALQYLILFVPFFFAAFCICLTFSRFGEQSPSIYSADLLGASFGSLLAMLLIFMLPPQQALFVISSLALSAALLTWSFTHNKLRYLMLFVILLVPWTFSADWIRLHPSQYKALSQSLLIPGSRILDEKNSPLGQVTVLQNTQIPLRQAPGMSMTARGEPPQQMGLFVDGEGPAAITHFDGDMKPLTFLGQMPSATPYQLLQQPSVLILGAGTGMDVLQALYHGAKSIDAVELDANIATAVSKDHATFAGRIYAYPSVKLHIADARSFVAGSQAQFDLIVLPLSNTFSTTSAGLYGLAEDYLYTKEAVQAYLSHLRPDGMLVYNRWVQLPPRDLIKLAAMVIAALEDEGVPEPARHLALLRGWQSAALAVKRSAFTAPEKQALLAYAEAQGFDLEWAGGEVKSLAHHRLDQPYFQAAFAALSGTPGERASFLENYKFHLTSPTDDQPYFHHFFTWRALPEILRLKDRGGLPLMEIGYPILLATLLQAMLFGAILILLPLRMAKQKIPVEAAACTRIVVYFAALGMAFMLLEMAFLQKFILLLGHPLYAAATVLASFLLFGGLGSRFSARLKIRKLPILWPVAGIVLLGMIFLAALPSLLSVFMGWPLPVRLMLGIVLVAPLAFCMGMPFPLGMARTATMKTDLLPWAYGVNACFSVMSAPLATLLAIQISFNGVVLLALGLYLAALSTFPQRTE
jgi:hypothetical protein